MFDKRCKNKEHFKAKEECAGCNKKRHGCGFKHFLIDNSIILSLFEREYADICDNLLNKIGIKYLGYMTTDQVGRLLRTINSKEFRIENEKRLPDIKMTIASMLEKLQIIPIQGRELKLYNQLNDKLLCESHDKVNICASISNELDIITTDKNMIGDLETIKKLSNDADGHKIDILHIKDKKIKKLLN